MKHVMENDKYSGLKKVEVVDDYLDVTFPMLVLYPTETPEKEEKIGPYLVDVSLDAKLEDERYPLVVISHGTGGTPLVYRHLARDLAKRGFIVAMPEHPFNNVKDNQLERTTKVLKSRPKNITQVIDWFDHSDSFKDHINFEDISIIGHSMGGYTAIAVTGGTPTTLPWETGNETPERIDVDVDERIKKVILFAPALGWFRNEGALEKVHVPIFIMTGERDEITPSFHAEILLNGVINREKIVHKVIENAGHFSFLSPFPPEMKATSFPPSQDPEGFNRELFQQELAADVLSFLLS